MNASTSDVTMGSWFLSFIVLGAFLGIAAAVLRACLIGLAGGPRLQRRRSHSVEADECDHPYADVPMNDLVGHIYEKHFEVWNLLGEKSPAPDRWRREHAAEHGFQV